ncbi:MAG: hypothetical protein HDT19_02550, partial [Oscillibacter sp.]|nr:hypothetical protein [Oscillibacter sp.]
TPDTVVLAGAAYLDEDLWQGGFFYNGMTMLFRVEEGRRIPLDMEEDDYYVDCFYNAPMFSGYVLRILLKNNAISLAEAPEENLLWMFYENQVVAMNLLGAYPAGERDAALTALAQYAANEADDDARECFQQGMRNLSWNASELTEEGREAYQTLLAAVEQTEE